MKKAIILSTLACIVSFTLGMSAGWHGHKSQSRAVYKLAILKGQLADSIMSNNNVYDMDGSDQMASYLYVSARLDTLLAKQRALCLSYLGHSHSPLATNKHLLLTNDNQY